MHCVAFDTETTGSDFVHGCKPFFVSACTDKGEILYWEWDVDPLTREPAVPFEDLIEIGRLFKNNRIVGHNLKFDVRALKSVGFWPSGNIPWEDCEDTLIASHVLESAEDHGLKTLALRFLDISDDDQKEIHEAANKARVIGRKLGWRVAEAGDPHFPAQQRAPDGGWGVLDMWLPRAVAKHYNYPKGECSVVKMGVQDYDVRIDRASKWGNPFIIGKDGTREEVIQKYRQWIKKQPKLMQALPELDGKVLGCHCKPQACHGDVLVELVSQLRHPWWDVCRKYAVCDAERTLALWYIFEAGLREEGLLHLYQTRRKLLQITWEMEEYGVSLSQKRLDDSLTEYKQLQEEAEQQCYRIAEHRIDNIASSQQLQGLLFGTFGLTPVKKTKSGQGFSTDQKSLEEIRLELPEGKPKRFLEHLADAKSYETAVRYLRSYRLFGIPDPEHPDFWLLHPGFNITGTDTTRFSSSNPNAQNLSAKEKANLRKVFGPRPGREWFALDYSNLEMRIPANVAGETELIELFNSGGSYHNLIAKVLHTELYEECERDGVAFKERHEALYKSVKNGNFAGQYDASPRKQDATYGVPGASAKIAARLPKIKALSNYWKQHAQEHGYVVTLGGYRLQAGRDESGSIRPTTPFNYFTQGSAGIAMINAMIRVHAYLHAPRDDLGGKSLYDLTYRMILTIHDELDFDFPRHARNLEVITDIRLLMEKSGDDFNMPLPVEIKWHPETWGDVVKISEWFPPKIKLRPRKPLDITEPKKPLQLVRRKRPLQIEN